MSPGADAVRGGLRWIEHRRRVVPRLREPIRDARVASVDRVPPAMALLCVLVASALIHVAILKGAAGTRRRADLVPTRPAEIRVAVIERPPPPAPAPPVVVVPSEAAAPVRRRRQPRATAAPEAPARAPTPAPETPPAPTETPHPSEGPPLLMPGVSLSATTAAGGLAVRTGKGGGGPGPAGSPGGGGGVDEPGGGIRAVPGYALTEEPVFLDNVSAADIRRYYPEEARKAKIEGAVKVKLLVDEEGGVARATLVSDPSGAFGRAAIKVARLYRFKPAKVNDRRVATEIVFTIHFELD